ncbi:hypothetical protein dsx2_0088 [Desulfovibrio sp. X2]|uniref:hypothetical protein n=1 Tax=Desulfovibrio sp. X2 TaxID=941449 RepID=UPI0003589C96|nr:hypothetical protein [Desulfovibrio sp. X2]EPR43864.1 hypothetical protein dsx2_0088 [Desulfovibrio sp. X2]
MNAALHLYEDPHLEERYEAIDALPVHPALVMLSDDAKASVGEAFREVAFTLCCDPSELTRGAHGEMLWHPAEDCLSLRLSVPELEAEMYVEIPSGHWSFRTGSHAEH